MGRQVVGYPNQVVLRKLVELVVELRRVNLELCVGRFVRYGTFTVVKVEVPL